MRPAILLRISVATSVQAEEPVAALMERLWGQPAVRCTDPETGLTEVSVFLSRPRRWMPRMRARLRTGLANISALGVAIGPGVVHARRLRPQNWAESWKRHFTPLEFGRTLLIKPSWSHQHAKPGQVLVELDPGLSFGTGHHPTTAFCLRQLVRCRAVARPPSLLDIGTGSGILAIAAVLLGYRPVEAIDVDPAAVRVARANARHNQVRHHLRLARRDLSRLHAASHRQYDVICANLVADLLVAQAERIVNRLRPGGRLIVAGILPRQFGEVRRTYQRAGLRLGVQARVGGWQSGAFVRPGLSRAKD